MIIQLPDGVDAIEYVRRADFLSVGGLHRFGKKQQFVPRRERMQLQFAFLVQSRECRRILV